MTSKNYFFTAIFVIAAIVFSGCYDNVTEPDITAGQTKLFVAEKESKSGQLEWIGINDCIISSSKFSIYYDVALCSFSGYLYILEKFGADNIIKFDPSKNDISGVLYQKHLGDNWNPQDIQFVSETKAFISNMNQPKISIFNPSTGEFVKHIDISAYIFNPDSNASPYAKDLHLNGSDLYVLLQRRNGLKPGAPTLMLKINSLTDSITDTIPFQFKSGYAMAYYDGVFYVTNPSSQSVSGDGAIEKVVLSSKTVNTIIDETALGGSPIQIVHKINSRFYVTVYMADFKKTKVIELDAVTGMIVSTLPNVKDAFGGIFYDEINSKLYVGERDAVEMGIRIFQNNKQIGSTIKSSNSLPPSGMMIVR